MLAVHTAGAIPRRPEGRRFSHVTDDDDEAHDTDDV